MKRLNLFNPDKLIPLLRWVIWPAIIAYFVSMVIYPWVSGGFRWSYVQGVWDHWQSLNVGMLALIASVIAFEATRYKEDKQRLREVLAARAFLPASLSELGGYLKDSAAAYKKAWDDATTRGATAPAPPQAASSYKGVFTDCIKLNEPDVGEFLSAMLSELQVHDARLRELLSEYRPIRHTILSYLFSVGLLQTRVNKLFPFARGDESFDSTISWDDFHNAYKNLNIRVEDYEIDLGEGTTLDLPTFTKRWIARRVGEKEPEYTRQ